MHRLSNGSTTITNVLQLISKFLSKMVESGVLKTFTFLYSENHPYVNKNLENMIDIIEELKAILIKVCAGIQPQNEPLLEHQNTYHILSSATIDTECVRSEENITYSRHTADEFSFNEIHNTIERNIQLIAENENRMCDDLDHSFSSQEITTSTLKSTEHTMFSECSSINSLLKEDQNDFLQDMRFNSTETQDRSIPETNTVHYNQHVQYSQQCENTLQNIDLDILNRTNESYQQPNYSERINSNFDRIFDDQFPENESLLESECWNDINLPSTEPITSGIEIQASPFELTNLKNKIGTNLDESLVSDLDSTLNSELSNTVSSVPATYDINKDKHSDDFDQNKFFCEHCGNIFDTKLKLKIHLKRKHNVYVNNINRCDQCGKVFKKRATLLTHAGIHSEIKPYKCPYCWKTFTQKITRDSHVQLHTGSYKFSCQVCEKRFPTQAKLNFHSKCHEKPELRCEICSKMFTTKQYLNVHKKVHYKPNPPRGKNFSCTECSVLFYKKRDLLLHIKDSHPEMKFMCYFAGCSQTYSTYKRMIDHVYKKHTTKPSCENDKKTDTSKLYCTSCRISFVEKSSYFRHNLLVHRENVDVENSFNCVHCDKRFTTESSLDDHLEKFHNSVHSKEMNYSCSICGSLFYAESALKEHYKIHSDYSTHLCQTCGMVFSEKANFLMHQSVHDLKKDATTKKFQCETCDSRFENKMELRQHELDVHNIVPSVEELKPYSCSYCDKRFTTKGKCNLHMETHGKERNHKCTKCDKRFFRRDLLKEHMKTHNGYRAYVCKICGLAYSQKSSLKTHEKTHEKVEESISCEQCQKIFHSKQALNFHLKSHDGLFRFACEVCGKKFIRKCHYDLHLASHSVERPFKCLKCPASYKTNKHLREHSKKMHQNEPNFSSLFDSIYTEDEVVSQQNLLDEYIPSINPLQSELIFDKDQGASF